MSATEDLIPEVTALLVADPSVPTDVIRPRPNALFGGFALPDTHSFGGIGWRVHKSIWGCRWNKPGRFVGSAPVEFKGGGDYAYRPPKETAPLRFVRNNGDVIEPGAMVTDGASVPRVLWAVPGFSAMDFLPAAMIHDWIFLDHHCNPGSSWTFDEANLVLAEAMYTMMTASDVPYKAEEDWRVVVAYYAAVNSVLGRRIWSTPWSEEMIALALNP